MDIININVRESEITHPIGHWGYIQASLRNITFFDTMHNQNALIDLGDLFDQDYEIDIVQNIKEGLFVFVTGEGDAVISLNANHKSFFVLTSLWRDELYSGYYPGGLTHTELYIRGNDVFIVYERGVIDVVMKGIVKVKWRQDHQDINYHCTGIDSSTIWYEHEIDGTWGYLLSDGTRVEKHE